MENFGKQLKAYRELRGWSRQFVATKTDIPVATIEAWEAERRTPPGYVQALLYNSLNSIGLPNDN